MFPDIPQFKFGISVIIIYICRVIKRLYDPRIDKMLKQFPVVCLLGPRQSGKTTAARLYAKKSRKPVLYLDMESQSDLRKLDDPELFLKQHTDHLVIIDEVQFKPELFPLLRHLVDDYRKPGRFLLLGSASPELVKNASESLAGRVYYIDTFPFNISEIKPNKGTLRKHWFRGGFPDAWLARTDSAWLHWMDGYARTFIERDLNKLFGVTFSARLMYKIWRMIAHQQGGIWNAQSFSRGLDVSPTTINRYIDYLEGAYMVRKLQPYYVNTRKRLLKTPKLYFRDSGLLHYLMDIHSARYLQYHPIIGDSWEGYAIEQICQLLHQRIMPYYYRTHDCSEMDLVLVKGLAPIACIEIKYTLSPTISKGFRESMKDLKCKNNFIVTLSDTDHYKAEKDITICGLQPFINKVLPKFLK
jgi:predicted AAA+ superfamily ATPase